MSLNKIILNGKTPHFDGTYKAGESDGDKKKNSFLSWAISVKRDYKKPDEQYYPEDLIPIKAFGPKADFINKNFPQGKGIVITGRLTRDEDYTDDSGETKKGQLYVLVEDIHFPEASRNDSESAATTTAKSNKSDFAPKKPGIAPKKPGMPPKKSGVLNRPF